MNQSLADGKISRADLALVLKTATEIRPDSEDGAISLEEAERVAVEVGIQPSDFRAAVASLRSVRAGRGRLFGAHGVLAAEGSIGYAVSPDRAAHMLAQAQLYIGTGGKIEAPADGLWRLSDSGTLLQIGTLEDVTTISAAADRRRMKAALIGGGGVVGSFGGVVVASAAAMVGWGSVEAMALAQVIGVSGGAVAGVLAGVAGWRSAAKRAQQRVFTALERMRMVAGSRPDGGGDHRDVGDRAIR